MIYRLGLTGYPLGHSLSPVLHKAALAAAGLAGSYVRFPVPPGSVHDAQTGLPCLLQDLRVGRLQGLNVTIPHKERIFAMLDAHTGTAAQIGAVNTVWSENGRLIGGNTDADGFYNDLVNLGFDTPRQGPGAALVLGAGGAARAVVHALAGMGWQVCLITRRLEQASALANALQHVKHEISVRPLETESFMQPYDLIVNATPLGMPPSEGASPWPAGLPFPAGASVYDLVYQRDTPLLQAARAAGAPAAGGLGMLVEQAALSFKIWTGVTASKASMFEAAGSAIGTIQKGIG